MWGSSRRLMATKRSSKFKKICTKFMNLIIRLTWVRAPSLTRCLNISMWFWWTSTCQSWTVTKPAARYYKFTRSTMKIYFAKIKVTQLTKLFLVQVFCHLKLNLSTQNKLTSSQIDNNITEEILSNTRALLKSKRITFHL